MTAVYVLFGLWLCCTLYFFGAQIMRDKPLSNNTILTDHVWWVGIASIIIWLLMWVVRFNITP